LSRPAGCDPSGAATDAFEPPDPVSRRAPDPADHVRSRLPDLLQRADRPLIVAIDGRSGAGKSTLAATLAAGPGADIEVTVIEGDDFYAGGSAAFWDALSARGKVDHVIDWRRQRRVIGQLRTGREARWRPFDWQAFDGRLAAAVAARPSPLVIVEGVYSGRPELADLVDLRVLLDTPADERHRRLEAREGPDHVDDWYHRWTEAEEWYFGTLVRPEVFDLVVR
jgi:uridine kinase